MNSKDFMLGYFTAAQMLKTSLFSYVKDNYFYIDSELQGLPLQTKSQGKVYMSINRGISPDTGRVGFCTEHLQDSTFDIAKNWVNADVWQYIEQTVRLVSSDSDEARLSFEELCNVLDFCGGIDYNQTVKKMLKS
jgi:hypothetical protein